MVYFLYHFYTKHFYCSIGIQKNEHVCIDEDTNKLLKPHYCKAPPPPTALHTTCQLPSCPPRLASSQLRFSFFFLSSLCRYARPKWLYMNNLLFYRWDAGNFGVCSASCGGGFRVRHVRCVQKRESDVVKVPDSECSADTAPHPLEKCNLHHCPARYYPWFINDYVTFNVFILQIQSFAPVITEYRRLI